LLVSQNRGKYEIKIIDFGESTTIDQTYQEEEAKILGSTIPYSPIECSVPCEEGFNKKEIDLWSIGVLFYEALLGRKPITYSRCFQQDIYKGWKRSDEFNIFPNIRKKGGIRSFS
jgi:serine/threonine protein kinase